MTGALNLIDYLEPYHESLFIFFENIIHEFLCYISKLWCESSGMKSLRCEKYEFIHCRRLGPNAPHSCPFR